MTTFEGVPDESLIEQARLILTRAKLTLPLYEQSTGHRNYSGCETSAT